MRFISLIDTHNQNIITVDADSLILRVEIEENSKEIRLKSYMASVIYELFYTHPTPLTYDNIISILKKHNLIISDLTRMHRKISEIRNHLLRFHPSLNEILLNTRGFGYGLPLRLKKLHQIEKKEKSSFKSKDINKAIDILHNLINDAIDMTAQNNVVQHRHGYVINRDHVRHDIVEKIVLFNACKKTILEEIRVHEADFTGLRVNYLLAKLKTYIGLARISEYPISETQWLDWFKQEVWLLFEELKKWIRFSENS